VTVSLTRFNVRVIVVVPSDTSSLGAVITGNRTSFNTARPSRSRRETESSSGSPLTAGFCDCTVLLEAPASVFVLLYQ
jgi:hypothetical protein